MTVRKTGALQEDIMIEIEVPVSLCFDSFWRVCRHSQHVASPPARSGRVATSQKHGGDKHKSLSRFPDLPSRPGDHTCIPAGTCTLRAQDKVIPAEDKTTEVPVRADGGSSPTRLIHNAPDDLKEQMETLGRYA